MAEPNFDPMAAAKTGAILFGAWTLLLWILAKIGFYTDTAALMGQFHLFFDLTILGLFIGTAESLIYGGICGYAIAWLYNKL